MDLDAPICTACGTQFPPMPASPARCPICDDERQYLPVSGQGWTSLARLRFGHANTWRQLTPDLLAIHTAPHFAIGQRALLLRTPAGNVLWDCLTLIDEATLTLLRALGGVAAIAISHPHYYTTMVEWGRALQAPVHLHAADRGWVMRDDPALRFWDGARLELLPGVTLVRTGGHFAGSVVLHWAGGAAAEPDGGVLLAGDTLQVVPDGKHVGFMRSYPNLIPLPAAAVDGIVAALAGLRYRAIYSAFPDREITTDAMGAVARSAARYQAALASGFDGPEAG